MNFPPFEAPALDDMNAMLPAFGFQTLIAANPLRAVYLATQRSLDRNVAIKILAPSSHLDTDFRKSFEATAHAMARLNHPNLITVFDSGIVRDMLYCVMEFVPGKSLERSAKDSQIEYSQAIHLVLGICAGIAHAHSHGIVHGTLNPSHILLNQKAEPKIGNFGLARSQRHPADANSDKDDVSYVAPEIPGAPNPATEAADQFAIGAILYRLLTGTPHSQSSLPPSKLANCPESIDDIWRKATHKNPAERFQSVAALQKALATPPDKKTQNRQQATAKEPALAPLKASTSAAPSAPEKDAPAQPASTPAAPAQVKYHPGFNWKLLRNLLIIVGLLFAINAAWKRYKNSEQRNREIIAKQEASRKEKIQERLAESRKNSSTPPRVPTQQSESPEQSLARLRSSLASGNLTEMPIGTVQRGDCQYLLVHKTMTWPEAAWFAECHGAHIAIPNRDADLTWLHQTIAAKEAVWIGAARSGKDQWTLADGSLWKPAKAPDGNGSYVGVDKRGYLRTGPLNLRLPFILQWHQDGSNPGSLEAILAATRSSIQAGTPLFPPGTHALANRHFLHVVRPVTWQKARQLAETSGGHLAVPANAGEIGNLVEITRNLNANDGLWLGGFKDRQNWLWVTHEPWKTIQWSRDANPEIPEAALVVIPGRGFDARKPTSPANGFIIEWSQDPAQADHP